jgi:hypothetical protein
MANMSKQPITIICTYEPIFARFIENEVPRPCDLLLNLFIRLRIIRMSLPYDRIRYTSSGHKNGYGWEYAPWAHCKESKAVSR